MEETKHRYFLHPKDWNGPLDHNAPGAMWPNCGGPALKSSFRRVSPEEFKAGRFPNPEWMHDDLQREQAAKRAKSSEKHPHNSFGYWRHRFQWIKGW